MIPDLRGRRTRRFGSMRRSCYGERRSGTRESMHRVAEDDTATLACALAPRAAAAAYQLLVPARPAGAAAGAGRAGAAAAGPGRGLAALPRAPRWRPVRPPAQRAAAAADRAWPAHHGDRPAAAFAAGLDDGVAARVHRAGELARRRAPRARAARLLRAAAGGAAHGMAAFRSLQRGCQHAVRAD